MMQPQCQNSETEQYLNAEVIMKGSENKSLEISIATISSLLDCWGNTVLTLYTATKARIVLSFFSNSFQFASYKDFLRNVIV